MLKHLKPSSWLWKSLNRDSVLKHVTLVRAYSNVFEFDTQLMVKNRNFRVNTQLNSDKINFHFKHLTEANGKQTQSKQFPLIWLRDNCQCEKCYNYSTQEVDIDVLQLDQRACSISELSQNGNRLNIVCQ